MPSITPIMVLGFIYRPAAMTPGASLMSTCTCTGSLRRLNASARRLHQVLTDGARQLEPCAR